MAGRNVAVLLLYNDRKEILLQHRTSDAERLPNYWAFFGGGLEDGETPEQALAREIREELEYAVRTPRLILTQKMPYRNDEGLKYVFVEQYDSRQSLVLHEGQGMKWWRFEDMASLPIIEHDRIALAKVCEYVEQLRFPNR